MEEVVKYRRISKIAITPPPAALKFTQIQGGSAVRAPSVGPPSFPSHPTWWSRTGPRQGRGPWSDQRTSRARTGAEGGSDSPRDAKEQRLLSFSNRGVGSSAILVWTPDGGLHLLGLLTNDLVRPVGPRPPGDLTDQGLCVRAHALGVYTPPRPGPFSLCPLSSSQKKAGIHQQQGLSPFPCSPPGENLLPLGQEHAPAFIPRPPPLTRFLSPSGPSVPTWRGCAFYSVWFQPIRNHLSLSL